MRMARLLFCTLLFCVCALAQAAEFFGKVVAVMDGDTLLVMSNGKPVKIRLAEIDAPEKTQPFGVASQESLAEMVKGKQIKVTTTAVDDYGRLIATVHIGEVSANHEQVRRGMAWEYSRFHSNKDLIALQREAQQAERGLWAGDGAVEPSQWRKQHAGEAGVAAFAPPSSTRAEGMSGVDSGQGCEKKRCAEMSSCEDARSHFTQCGQRALDGDADGKPCENLCSPVDEQANQSEGDRAKR